MPEIAAPPSPDTRTDLPGVSPPRTLRTWRRARRAARRDRPEPIAVPTLETTDEHIETSAGPVRVRSVGAGPPILFVHGLLVDGRVWDGTVAELAGQFRCILPDLPLGAHQAPMKPDADLSLGGVVRILDELVEALELDDLTVVANDSGGAITQLWMGAGAPRVGRAVLLTCDAFDNFPPPGFNLYLTVARSRLALRGFVASTRLRAVRHMPIAYGLLTHRPIDDGLVRSWLAPASTSASIRHDLRAFLCSAEPRLLVEVEPRLRAFDRPVLLVWSPEQRWFPIEHAERLAALLPDASITEILGSGAFPQLDQPAAVASAISGFVTP